MPTAQLSTQQRRESAMDEADDLVPVVGAIFQAGPPAYALVGVGAVVTLLACSPLMILVVVLMISLAVTAMVVAVIVVPVVAVLCLHQVVAGRRAAEPCAARDPLRRRVALAPARARAGLRLTTSDRRTL